jgi:hypothetical protein
MHGQKGSNDCHEEEMFQKLLRSTVNGIFQSVFGSVVTGAFQIAFRAEMHANDIFLFFKNHF